MIVPITLEHDWLEAIASARPWTPPTVPTVVIAPHPDDETLAAGGLIARLRESGVPVEVVAVTDGENAYAGEQGLGPIREQEQADALARLGVAAGHLHRLHLTDSGVTELEAELTAALEPLLRGAGHVVAPWPHDFHPDHEATGRAVLAVAHRLGIPVTLYFFWTWHRGTPPLLQGMPLLRLELSETQQLAKREALLCHASQLHHSSGEPILPDNLLAPAFRTFEVFYADPQTDR